METYSKRTPSTTLLAPAGRRPERRTPRRLGSGPRARLNAVDLVGALASGACVAHCAICALLPGAVATLTALGLGAVADHGAERVFILLALIPASLTLVLGWRRHRLLWIAGVLVFGIVGLLLAQVVEARVGEHVGTAVGVVAGLSLALGHLFNIRASRACRAECA